MKTTIDMAREVESEVGFQWCVNFIELARFEALVRADEREACARVCDSRALEYEGLSAEQNASEKLADAIRARGNT